MSQPLHSAHERRAAASRLERAGLEPALAAAVIEEIHRGESRFATADQLSTVGDRVVKTEVAVANLQGDLRAMEARLNGRIDVLAAEIVSMRTIFDGRFEAVDGKFEAVGGRFEAVDRRFEALDRRMDEGFKAVHRRMGEGFGALRRENRLLLLFFSTMLGLLMALFRFGVL